MKFIKRLYRFDLSVLFCLRTPVIPAEAGISSIHRSTHRDSRFRGHDGVNENENKKFALKQTGIFKPNRYNYSQSFRLSSKESL